MSLLIEALKRAEEDAKKRKLVSASNAPGNRAVSAGAARPPSASGLSLPVKVQGAAHSPTVEDFPELTLASTEPSARLANAHIDSAPLVSPAEHQPDLQPHPKPAAQPIAPAATAHGTYPATSASPPTHPTHVTHATLEITPLKEASPDNVRSTQPASRSGYKAADKTTLRTTREPAAPDVMAARSAAYSGGATNSTPAVELTPDMATTANVPSPVTPRQAKSAASVMAGQSSPGAIKAKQRRQAVLLSFVVLMALPVAAFYLFGDALLNSTSMLPVSAINTSPPAVVSPSAIRSTAPSVALVSPAPAITAASAPAVERRTPVSRPAQVADNVRRTSIVTPAATATSVTSQVTPTVVTGPAKPAPLLASAYAAYQTGKPDEAARLYREVLKSDPGQRDAWLGLAVIAHAGNQREPAMDAYKRVLRLEPQNPTALAGLSSLNGGSDEPRQESRLRELLARSPQEADLNHALGLVLSGEQRWSEAQPLFFKAHALAPQEPKFAYNLAVTLDHLRKPSLAIQYYDTALVLAKGQSTAFDEQSARNRVSVLKASAAENKSP